VPTSTKPDQDDLSALMCAYQGADRAAAERFAAAVTPILSRFYYYLAGDTRHVDDLVQECWLRIHRARHTYRPGEPVLPWLFAIARHTRVDIYRRWQRSSARESSIDDVTRQPSQDPRLALESSLDAQAVLRCLQALPEAQREVLLMMKLNGMSVAEIARATGSSEAAVKQKAYRAYRAVRQMFRARGEGR